MSYSEHTSTARVGASDTALVIKAGTITADESWAPYMQAEIIIPLGSEALMEEIDPRDDVRVSIYADSSTVLGVSASRYFNLGIRQRAISLDGECTISLATDEALLMDHFLTATTPDTGAEAHQASLRGIVQYVLDTIDATLEPGSDDFDFTISAEDRDADVLTWFPGESAWDFIQPLFQTAGFRLFCDEQRRWHLVDGSTYLAAGHTQLAYAITLATGIDTIDRNSDEWCDSAVVIYEYDGEVRGYDSYSDDLTPTKTKTVTVDRPFTGPGLAEYMVKRARGRGRQLSLGAESQYATTPAQPFTATIPWAPVQYGVVRSVAWDLTEGLMVVETRGLTEAPDDSYLVIDPELTYLDIDPDLTYADMEAL